MESFGKSWVLKGVFIFAAVLCLASCRPEQPASWITYSSQGKIYKVDYPADWKAALNGHAFDITPPNGTGLVVVTGYVGQGKVFDEKAFRDMVMLDFAACHVEDPFKPVHGTGWVGEDAVYFREIHRRKFIYLFRIAHRGQVGAFIAVSDIDGHFKPLFPDYQQIMNSLIVLDAPSTVEDLSLTPPAIKKKQSWQETLIRWIRSTESKTDEKKTSYFSN